MNTPLVSVIIPNYNHAQFLDERIQSVLNQTYQNFELIILDDKSTDNSVEFWKSKPMGEVSWHEWNDHKSARKITQAYGVKAIPTFILISPEGRIEKKCVGVQTFLNEIKK